MGQNWIGTTYQSQLIYIGGYLHRLSSYRLIARRSWLIKPDFLEAPDLEDVETLIENKMAVRSRKANKCKSVLVSCGCSCTVLLWICNK